MISQKKQIRSFLFALASIIFLLFLQTIWIYNVYTIEYKQIMNSLKDSFIQAYQKEQTYRVPVVDIVNPGAITIQSCGTEEIMIVRNCPKVDTIVYKNVSGHSIESFINQVFWGLREKTTPLNIYCLADLFAGMLHDEGINVAFVIERYYISTGEILETSFLPGKIQPKMKGKNVIILEISGMEALRVILNLGPENVLIHISGIIILSFCLIVFAVLCIIFLYHDKYAVQKSEDALQTAAQSPGQKNTAFRIGQYHFDPNKNELTGFGECIQLNKKENSILQSLCAKQGNIVERNYLLDHNWGSLGLIYSRSLDTYIATLRKYLKKDPTIQIITIKGVGYKLAH